MTDRFEQIQIGDEAELTHRITVEDVDTFARLTGDNNPLHVNEEFASKTSFRHRVVHGMLTASFISTMIGTRLPGRGSLWYEQHTKFLGPVRIGEEIRVWAKVVQKTVSQRVVRLQIAVYGSDGRKVIEGEAKVMVLKPEERKKSGVNMSDEKKNAVIISGSSRGIGAATARSLASDGHAVVVNYLSNASSAEELVTEITAAGGRAIAVGADVSDRAAVDQMVQQSRDEFGAIAGIVNNASGPINAQDFLDLSWEDMQGHISTQLKGAFNLSQSVLPHLIEQKSGVIVNIASIYGENVPPPKLVPYNTVKAALISFSNSLAVEYGQKGIRVNCVSPGMTHTDLIANVPEKTKMVTKMQTPLRRLADPEDVANAVSFLFSDKASFMTGQNLRVCGGSIMP